METELDAQAATQALAPLVDQYTVLLTSYRRVGTPVGTPVSIAVDGTIAYVRTWATAGKIKRIRHTPVVEVEASTIRGRPTVGPKIRATARLLSGDDERRARRLLARKHPVLHGVLVPFAHKLARYQTVHLELTPVALVTPSP